MVKYMFVKADKKKYTTEIFSIIITSFIIMLFLNSCYFELKKDFTINPTLETNESFSFLDTPKVFDEKYFENSKIIFPKPKTDGQMLSAVVVNDEGKLIIFDGGRVDDAKYLVKIIKNYVKAIHIFL